MSGSAFGSPGLRLQALLAESDLPALPSALIGKFEDYLSLLLRWNVRINLTAIREEPEILSRHFVESIACAWVLPASVRSLLDFGAGAGFPGIPIAICRPEIHVTLAESQVKKAAFLREAVRTLELDATVYGGRAETLYSTFDCVTLRAVDRMNLAIKAGSALLKAGGWLVVMTTGAELGSVQSAAGTGFAWKEAIQLARSADRVIAAACKADTL